MGEGNLPATSEETQFFSLVERLATNPDVDVNKLKQILEMQEHILDKNAEQAFNAAMVQAQRQMPLVPRDKKNQQTNSKYSAYETILKHCKPVYTKNGFSILFYEGDARRENEIRIMADIMHEQGHTKTRYVDVPIDSTGIQGKVNKTATHAKGSSVSYGRSYLLRMIFNVPTGDDDDGNAASGLQRISDEQFATINNMVKQHNVDLKLFLDFMGVESLEEIPKSQFQKAVAALNKKKSTGGK